jgi:predicted transcriptional regulator
MSLLQRLFSNVAEVDVACAEVTQARSHLLGTIEEIQARLAPRNIVDEAMEQLRMRSVDFAKNAGRTARERPMTVVASVTGLALLLAHKPLGRLVAKILRRNDETEERIGRSTRNTPHASEKGRTP